MAFFSYKIDIFVKKVKACRMSVLFFRPTGSGRVGLEGRSIESV